MANLPSRPTQTLLWSKEKMRQRGVRAVVEALRLHKEHQLLSHQRAGYFAQTRILMEYLKDLESFNRTFAQLLKAGTQSLSKKGNGNS